MRKGAREGAFRILEKLSPSPGGWPRAVAHLPIRAMAAHRDR